MDKANLKSLSTENQLLAEFILILTVSYHLPTKLGWLIHCYIEVSEFAQVGLTFMFSKATAILITLLIIVLKLIWITNIEYKEKW